MVARGVQKSTHRLVDAYQEGLLSLEELRRRVPDLKKRKAALTSELRTLEASVVDEQKRLQLVENLEHFLLSKALSGTRATAFDQ